MSGYKSVTNSTDLALALYEDAREMVLSGPLASGIYHGCKSIRRLRICVVLFGILGLGCVYYPQVLLPALLVFPVLMAIFVLPLIYLSFANVSPGMVNRVRRRYLVLGFDPGMQSLHLKNRCARFEGDNVEIPRRRTRVCPMYTINPQRHKSKGVHTA